MSKVKNNSNAKVWAPPVFPVEGRLPGDVVTVTANYKKQTAEEHAHHRNVNSKGQSQRLSCCHSLHISLFFDGRRTTRAKKIITRKSAWERFSCGIFPMQPEIN
ncbi:MULTISPECIES: hypothetical protein [unclassified Pseudomonas]|uniref:hypothetical protein n=1 Tax=unclassified Pseudomonas TaxID=196821 RepID=UPI0015AB3C67|nr:MULTISPECIES: hypothetical protein [unclassified Pseudomonas]